MLVVVVVVRVMVIRVIEVMMVGVMVWEVVVMIRMMMMSWLFEVGAALTVEASVVAALEQLRHWPGVLCHRSAGGLLQQSTRLLAVDLVQWSLEGGRRGDLVGIVTIFRE